MVTAAVSDASHPYLFTELIDKKAEHFTASYSTVLCKASRILQNVSTSNKLRDLSKVLESQGHLLFLLALSILGSVLGTRKQHSAQRGG